MDSTAINNQTWSDTVAVVPWKNSFFGLKSGFFKKKSVFKFKFPKKFIFYLTFQIREGRICETGRVLFMDLPESGERMEKGERKHELLLERA